MSPQCGLVNKIQRNSRISIASSPNRYRRAHAKATRLASSNFRPCRATFAQSPSPKSSPRSFRGPWPVTPAFGSDRWCAADGPSLESYERVCVTLAHLAGRRGKADSNRWWTSSAGSIFFPRTGAFVWLPLLHESCYSSRLSLVNKCTFEE
jgi:hypothetical protein